VNLPGVSGCPDWFARWCVVMRCRPRASVWGSFF
jgi:hypothetical protein